MNTARITQNTGGALLLACLLCSAWGKGQALEFTIVPEFRGDKLHFDQLRYTNGAGQTLSVTRLDLLLSEPSLQNSNGAKVQRTNWQAYLSLREGRDRFAIAGLAEERYTNLQFNVGVPPLLNHTNPAVFGVEHPLNPIVNGLHWGWQGGYVFLALEGRWIDPQGQTNGYSFHLATDRHLVNVQVPTERGATLGLDVARLFTGIVLTPDRCTTHSREDDPLPELLKKNLSSAFNARESTTNSPVPIKKSILPLMVAKSAKPFPLRFSSDFPIPGLAADNPLTEEGVELGRRLFFEPKLSRGNKQSCASCHDDQAAGVDPGKALSVGVEGKSGNRNAMPLFNLAWKQLFFWDGRAGSLREQVLMPIENPVEMNESLSNVVAKLKQTKEYRLAFQAAFGTGEITPDFIARALEQFLLTRIADDSKFDRALREEARLSEQEKRGFELFVTEYDPRKGLYGADCFHCHGGPLFVSSSFANNGLDFEPKDRGRGDVTGREGDNGKFATPSLRNVELTGPYMHDGRFATLEEVVEHYSTGMKRGATLDPNLAKHPDGGLRLSKEDQAALVAFLRTLTDEQLKPRQLVEER